MRNGRRRVLTYHSVSGASARRLPLERPEYRRCDDRPPRIHHRAQGRQLCRHDHHPRAHLRDARRRRAQGNPTAARTRAHLAVEATSTSRPHGHPTSVYAWACAMRDARCARALPHEAGHGRSSNACAGCRRAHARRRDARHAQPQYVTRARTNSGGGGSNGGDGGGDNSDGKGLQL